MRLAVRATTMLALAALAPAASRAASFTFSTGLPDGKIATASRAASTGKIEIETGDDFVTPDTPFTFTRIGHATFYGLLPTGQSLATVTQVVVEIYRVFPVDSTDPPSGDVPTRVNSPADIALDSRDSGAGTLTFSVTDLGAFSAANSVVNGINKKPNQFTGGEGSVSGEEVVFDVTFTPPFDVPTGHYFFVPQVVLSSGDFLWLSAPKPIVAPGLPFTGDLQTWIRNADLEPDWLRVGTDITNQGPFNAAFSLDGESGGVADVSATKTVAGTALTGATLTYTVVLTNAGPGEQLDNPGHEFTDTLPPSLALVNALASSGSIGTAGNTVTWDGSIAASSSVTITITARITANTTGGTVISNQGTASFDAFGSGFNSRTAPTDDPAKPGAADPTDLTVAAIPALGLAGLALLAGLIAVVAAVLLRRAGRG